MKRVVRILLNVGIPAYLLAWSAWWAFTGPTTFALGFLVVIVILVIYDIRRWARS